jgi:hypothetical protein
MVGLIGHNNKMQTQLDTGMEGGVGERSRGTGLRILQWTTNSPMVGSIV